MVNKILFSDGLAKDFNCPAASIERDDLVRFELHSCVLIHILNSSVDNAFLFNEHRLQCFDVT